MQWGRRHDYTDSGVFLLIGKLFLAFGPDRPVEVIRWGSRYLWHSKEARQLQQARHVVDTYAAMWSKAGGDNWLRNR